MWRVKKGDNDNSHDDEDDGDRVRPLAGPKLSVVCYTRSNLTKNTMAGTWIGVWPRAVWGRDQCSVAALLRWYVGLSVCTTY